MTVSGPPATDPGPDPDPDPQDGPAADGPAALAPPPEDGRAPDRAGGVLAGAADRLRRHWAAWSCGVLFPRQAAVARIGFALTFAAFLLREWPNRLLLYGDRSPFSGPMARLLLSDNGAFTVLAWSDSRFWFELVYTLAFAVSVALALGWRTRAMSVLFMVAVLSLQNRAVLVGDGSDNVLHIMAIYLAFTRCGEAWSLDARRRRRRRGAATDSAAADSASAIPADLVDVLLWALLGLALLLARLSGFAKLGMLAISGWGAVFWAFWALAGLRRLSGLRRLAPRQPTALAGLDQLLDGLGNLLHGCALFVMAAEACLIYGTAGWYKIQGDLWQRGTALWFPLHLDYFSPWPALSHALAAHPLPVFLLSYGTVAVQVGFPFLVFHRRIKKLLLVALIAEHLGIAVLLGLPLFSAAMIAADLLFLPTALLLRIERAIDSKVKCYQYRRVHTNHWNQRS